MCFLIQFYFRPLKHASAFPLKLKIVIDYLNLILTILEANTNMLCESVRRV